MTDLYGARQISWDKVTCEDVTGQQERQPGESYLEWCARTATLVMTFDNGFSNLRNFMMIDQHDEPDPA